MEWLFWLSILFIGYTFVGYPLMLYVLVKVKNKNEIEASDHLYNKPISIIMVVCNESQYMAEKIQNIFNLAYPQELIKLIIVDDASDDNTVNIIESFSDDRIQLLQQSQRSGKAAGLNKAFDYVHTELTLLLDARQSISENAITDLASWFSNKKVMAVSGEVKFGSEAGAESGMDAYQVYERFIRKSEAQVFSVPGVSGAIYMLRSSAFCPIPKDTILDDVLIPMVASINGGQVGFDERVVAWDIPSDDWQREKKRKTRTLSGNYQLLFRNISWCLPLGHSNWFAFFSHKVTRLLAPLAMLIAMIASGYLALNGNAVYFLLLILIVSGLLVYPLSILLPAINRIKLLRICSAFVALNWFNVLGFASYLSVNKRQSWK